MKTVTIIGLGNMGFALAKGLLSSNVLISEQLKGIEMQNDKANEVSSALGIEVFSDYEVIKKSDVIILAVKPQNMKVLLSSLKPLLNDQLIISIAAGITVKFLKEELGDKKIVRTMPNTPALVLKGVTGIYCTEKVNDEDRNVVENLLNAIGSTVLVDKEDDIDKITALSGSGPAYVYYFMEALEEAGVMIGLSRDTARKLVVSTFEGSTALIKETSKTPQDLRIMVTSPAGTTIAALHMFEKGAIKGAVLDGVAAAYKRAKELGN